MMAQVAQRRESAGWTGLLAELSGGDHGGGDHGGATLLTHGFDGPPAPGADDGGDHDAHGSCWADVLSLEGGEFGLDPMTTLRRAADGTVCPTHAFDVHAAQQPYEQLPARSVDADGLRCLDATHPPACTRCTAAPLHSENVHLYSQGAGLVAGEKLLRRLLLASPEWSNAAAREAAGAAADADGDPATAACVRTRSSPALRKGSMLALCRYWRYKCDVFTPSPYSAAAQTEARCASPAEGEAEGEQPTSDGSGSGGGDDAPQSPPSSGVQNADAAADGGERVELGADGDGAEGSEWRCLDESHPQTCGRCACPPPSDAAAATCVLRGSRKRLQHNGEKQLRAALCRTPEWRDPAARAAAAQRLAAAGAPNTARAVAERDCSALRKLDMLRLCRLWRLRSDIWQARVDATPPPRQQRASPRPTQPRHAAQARIVLPPHVAMLFPSLEAAAAMERELPGGTVPPPPPSSLDVPAVHAYLHGVIAPAIRYFIFHGCDATVFAASKLLPHDTPSAMDSAACRRSAAVVARMQAAAASDLARLRGCVAALDASTARVAPASCLGSLAPPLAEGHVYMLRLVASGMAEHIALMASPTHGLVATNGRQLNPMEQAQLKGSRACNVALQHMGSAMQGLLLRTRDSDAATYLAAGCGILDLITELLRLTVLNELGRAEWAAGRPCSWRSRFFDSCAAVAGEMMPHRMHAAFEATSPAAAMDSFTHLAMPQFPNPAMGLVPFYTMR